MTAVEDTAPETSDSSTSITGIATLIVTTLANGAWLVLPYLVGCLVAAYVVGLWVPVGVKEIAILWVGLIVGWVGGVMFLPGGAKWLWPPVLRWQKTRTYDIGERPVLIAGCASLFWWAIGFVSLDTLPEVAALYVGVLVVHVVLRFTAPHWYRSVWNRFDVLA